MAIAGGDKIAGWVEAVRRDDRAAFAELVRQFQDAVAGVVLAHGVTGADVEDLAQEAFVAAYRQISELRDPAKFGSWVCGIARNLTRRWVRDRRREEPLSGDLAANTKEDTSDLADHVMAAVGRLQGRLREPLTMFYINGYTTAEVADLLELPAGTVRRRLHEARNDLRKGLTKMLPSELKRHRPGKKLARDVLHRITKVRVFLSGGRDNCMILTDAKGRSYSAYLGRSEAEEILPKVSGASPTGPPDIHTALAALLEQVGDKILSVTLCEGKDVNYTVRVRLRSRGRTKTVETIYAGRDAVQFAVHTGADVFYDKPLAEKLMIRRKDGNPMSPAGAWRKYARTHGPPYKNIQEVLRALEKNPDNKTARRAIEQANPNHLFETPLVERSGKGIEEVEEWMTRHKGERLEGVASGLIGLLYLHPNGDLSKAVRYLKRAHRLQPEDRSIAFDYATVCTLSGKIDEAFALLEQYKFEEVETFANFKSLIDDPRFEKIVWRYDGKQGETYQFLTLG